MALINSRPLTYHCLNDPSKLEPLTPFANNEEKNHLFPFQEDSCEKKLTLGSDGDDEFSFWHNSFRVAGEKSTYST